MNSDYKILFDKYTKELSDLEGRMARLDWSISEKAKRLGLEDGWSLADVDMKLGEAKRSMGAIDAKMEELMGQLDGLE